MANAHKILAAITLSLAVVSTSVCAAYFPLDLDKSDGTERNESRSIKNDGAYQLPNTLKPLAYDIKFMVDKTGTTFEGSVQITGQVLETTDKIKLHKGPKLDVIFSKVKVGEKYIRAKNLSYDEKSEIVTYELAEPVKANETFKFRLSYNGTLRDDMIGFYRSTYIDNNNDEKWVAATQFEATHARHAFPCFDEPALKAKFTISIYKENLPLGYHCLSNMPLSSEPKEGFFVFEQSVPMSTYLVAFVISDFQKVTKSFVNVWTREELVAQADYAAGIALKSLGVFDAILNEKYHLPKMDLVAVPDFSAGAMENWGLLTFRESNLLYDDAHSTNAAQQRLASVVVHECAHMWFGNLVTPKWWSYLWLSEGFARYYQYMATAECEKGWRMEEQFVVEQFQSAMGVDALEESKPMTRKALTQSEIGAMGDSITYNKGASVLRMIEKTFGPDVFNSALRTYMQRMKFDNAAPADLWKALQEQVDKIEETKDRVNVTEFMKSWTEEAGFPYVQAEIKPGKIQLRQKRFLLRNSSVVDNKTVWSIPISLLSSATKESSTKPVFWFTEKENEMTYKSENVDWLILNVNSSGFYRVLYDNASWAKIIGVLRSEDFEKIPVLNRAAIVDDLLNFARAELIDYDIALNALLYLRNETDYLPFKSAFTSLDYLIKKFTADPDYELFKEYVVSLFSNAYAKLIENGNKNNDQARTLLLQEINNKACSFDQQDCIDDSKSDFSKWKGQNGKEGPTIAKNKRSAAYCAAIKYGDEDDWEFLWHKYVDSKVATEQLTILSALGCSKNDTILEKYLLNALNRSYSISRIRKQDITSVFSSIYSNLYGAEYMFKFIETQSKAIEEYYKNYDEIGSIVSGILKNYPIKKFIARVEALIKNPAYSSVKSSLKKSVKLANFELQWFKKHSNTIIEWIKKTEENTKSYRLPSKVVPDSYAIHLRPEFEPDFTFDGRVDIKAHLKEDTSEIVLHSDKLEIDDKQVFVSPYDNIATNYVIKKISYNKKYHFMTIKLEDIIKAKTSINITINYKGSLINPEMKGFYRSSYKNGAGKNQWMAATHLEPVGARRVFPCFDEPSLKATFNITVVAPKGYTVISNTQPKNKDNDVWVFETSPLMSTYLVAIAVSDFKSGEVNTDDKLYRVWANPIVTNQTSYSLSVMKPIVEDFEKRLGIDYELNKLEMIALPDFSSGAMENWGMITFRETNMLYDSIEMSSVAAKQSIRNVISHEIAHQWFGNLVSPLWWDYLWLNEGFARYFQYFQYSKDEDSWNLEAQFVVDQLHTSLVTDASSTSHPITHAVYSPSEIRGLFDTISYAKAASIIRMLEKLVGSTKFYSALQKYLKSNSYSSAEPSMLFSAFENEKANFNVTEFMMNWTTQAGFPVVNVTIEANKVTLTQERFFLKSNLSKSIPFTYFIPLTWATGKNPNFNDTQNVQKWLKEKSIEIDIPNADKDWVIFNLQQMGYYRVNYDQASWQRIFAVLDSDNYAQVNEINRAMIINDLFSLARAGQLGYDTVLAGTKYLRRETAYVPWKAARTGFSYFARRFVGHPTIYKAYKNYVLGLLNPIFEKLKFDDNEDDKHTDILLRKLVVDWMCYLDDKRCVDKALNLFQKQYKDPSQGFKIPPNQKAFVYCTAIRHGSEEDWQKLKKAFEKSDFATEKINILTALGCSQDSKLLKILLSDIIKQGSAIRLQDAQKVFTYVIDGGLVGVETTLDFIKDNHKQMSEYFGDDSVTKSVISTISKRLTTEKLFDKFKNFIDFGINSIPSISKALNSSLRSAIYERKWYYGKSMQILKLLDKSYDNDYRLPKTIVPIHYDIYLTPYFNNFTFDGKTIIKLNVLEDVPMIVINADKLSIKKITLDNYKYLKRKYNESTQQLFIFFDKPIAAETGINLIFEYTGELRNDMRGFYRSSYIDKNGDTKWLASTQFEPTYARSAFPCFDEPSFKATFKVNIARPKDHYHTLSNMGSNPVQEDHEYKKDYIWDKHEKSVHMSSYLVAFVVSDFVNVIESNSRVTVWAREELKSYCNYSSKIGSAALDFLDKKLAYKYELKEMNFVSVPDFDMGAMENWGLVTFREYGLSFDIHNISATYKRYVNTVVSHELVHMWFGNLVTLEWWDYTWLNEGFAEYVSHIVSHDIEKTWELLKQFVVNELQVALDVDAAESSHPMDNSVLKPRDIQDGFDKIAYQKAGSVLRMLHNSLGDEDFFGVLQNYMKKYNHANTRSEHLVAEFQNYYDSKKKTIPGKPQENITTIMNSWVTQAGYPLVNVSRSGDKIEFSQERFLVSSNNTSAKNKIYLTPITYTTETEGDFTDVQPKFWLGKDKKTETIKAKDSWYIANIQEVGFYRVNYDKHNWESLIKVLNSAHYANIGNLNRAQIIDDSLNLARAGYIDYHIALNATKYLSRETNYYSWKAFFNAAAYLSQRIEGQPEMKQLYSQHVLKITSEAYEKLGFNENMSDDAHLDQLTRELILTNACKHGHQGCREQSRAYFQKPVITPNIAAAVYCTAIEHGTAKEWDELLEKFSKCTLASDYITILKSLGCSRHPKVLEKYLDIALKPDSIIRRQDFATAVSSIYTSSRVGLETAMKYLANNTDKFYKHYGNWDDVGALFTSLAGRISTKEQIEDLKKLINDKNLEVVKSSLESAVKTAQKNLDWFEKYSGKIHTWLKEHYVSPAEMPPPTSKPGDSDGAATISIQISLLLIGLLSYFILS